MNLKIKNVRGQCYNRASAMAGTKSGVVTQFKDTERKMSF